MTAKELEKRHRRKAQQRNAMRRLREQRQSGDLVPRTHVRLRTVKQQQLRRRRDAREAHSKVVSENALLRTRLREYRKRYEAVKASCEDETEGRMKA
mgnify:CR=1 FL=1